MSPKIPGLHKVRLSAEHLTELRRLYLEHRANRLPELLRASHDTLDELVSGGGAMPSTVARIAARLDELALLARAS